MPHGRKKPFSGKAKKIQLQAKKQNKRVWEGNGNSSRSTLLVRGSSDEEEDEINVQKVNYQPEKGRGSGRNNSNRYNLQFFRDTEAAMKERKEEARKPLEAVNEEKLEIDIEFFFPSELKFPVRPPWDFSMSKEQLDAKENKYFSDYLKEIEKKFDIAELSYFELNLETWRQLWRVLEMADIVLIIVDIRFPALLFPPSLYDFVTKSMKKNIILVMNKIDLAPAPLVVAWQHYLKSKFPELHVLMFTSYPSYNLRTPSSKQSGLQIRRRKGRMRMAAEGAQKLLNACKEIVGDNVDLSSWQSKINEEKTLDYEIEEDVEIEETVNIKHLDTGYKEHTSYDGGILTIGCVGQPNVGKSSLINALMGKKVVSVSRTPGHTKHFQTIFLTPNVRLCDCPGLVFPSRVPKVLQVLMGSFPIAQLREPYTSVKYIAERLDLVALLKLDHPDNDDVWSAMDVCDGWAMKKGFKTARAARLDTYRAANHLLRQSLEGKIPLCLYPPNYTSTKDEWKNHPEVQMVEWIQASSSSQNDKDQLPSVSDYTSEEEEEEKFSSLTSKSSINSKETKLSGNNDNDEEDSESDIVAVNKFQALNTID
ncbi:nucleostemin 4 isoform X2 [Rhodnius prolixus]|uniref:Guanine nucleotide-binding protein-like 1 n=2 Tax=Rhodnius TaxID=13248 RepID=A0ABL0EI00_RHOPR